MILNLLSRRSVAGRSLLLALAAACLLASTSLAQRPAAAASRPMSSRGSSTVSGHTPAPGNNPTPSGRNASNRSVTTPGQPRGGLHLGLGGRWWDDHSTARRLSLNPDQQRRMDNIFEANKPTLMTLYNDLQRQEQSLTRLSHADLQDESKVFAAIDRVSHARSDLEKENAHILLQIRQQLAPQQLQTLDNQIATSH